MKVVSLSFIQVLPEDGSLGNSLSDSSKELLPKSRGGDRLLLITKNRYLKLMILILFCVLFYGKMQESWVIEIPPEICILTI